MTKTTKSVAFNKVDPCDTELLEFAKGFPNFSGYVKTLIRSDMVKKEQQEKAIRSDGGGIKLVLK